MRPSDPNCARPKFFGDQVRREGPQRRFVHIHIGQLGGDGASPWTRGMNIDIHDIAQDLLDRATDDDAIIERLVNGTGQEVTPACATIPAIIRLII